jgi:hypothetical protein
MSHKNRHGNSGGVVESTDPITESTDPVEAVEGATAFEQIAEVPQGNFVLTFKRNHPMDRASYNIAGNPGIVVFQRGLFVGAITPTSNDDLAGLPRTIMIDAMLVSPKADNKTEKAEKAAAKAIEKAAKAQAKIEAIKAKAEAKAIKAKEVLAAAQAKVAAAQAAKTEAPATE